MGVGVSKPNRWTAFRTRGDSSKRVKMSRYLSCQRRPCRRRALLAADGADSQLPLHDAHEPTLSGSFDRSCAKAMTEDYHVRGEVSSPKQAISSSIAITSPCVGEGKMPPLTLRRVRGEGESGPDPGPIPGRAARTREASVTTVEGLVVSACSARAGDALRLHLKDASWWRGKYRASDL